MDKLNDVFLEVYKSLDRLCKELHSTETGVTDYIKHMESESIFGRSYISVWAQDLSNLKRLRRIRNQLVHDVGTLGTAMCTRGDIEWMRVFCKQLSNQSDPISKLNRIKHELLMQNTDGFQKAEKGSPLLFALIVVLLCAVVVVWMYVLRMM